MNGIVKKNEWKKNNQFPFLTTELKFISLCKQKEISSSHDSVPRLGRRSRGHPWRCVQINWSRPELPAINRWCHRERDVRDSRAAANVATVAARHNWLITWHIRHAGQSQLKPSASNEDSASDRQRLHAQMMWTSSALRQWQLLALKYATYWQTLLKHTYENKSHKECK